VKVDSTLIGAAGEHLVLSRLLSRGLLAAQAPRGTRKVDILVNFLDGGEPCLIQVKARSSGGSVGWHMSEKHEVITDPDIFYTFVDFEPAEPVVYVIPAAIVADVLRSSHQKWLETPGKDGQPHNDTKFRRLKADAEGQASGWLSQYFERWDLLAR
jgi:hypothetical protein